MPSKLARNGPCFIASGRPRGRPGPVDEASEPASASDDGDSSSQSDVAGQSGTTGAPAWAGRAGGGGRGRAAREQDASGPAPASSAAGAPEGLSLFLEDAADPKLVGRLVGGLLLRSSKPLHESWDLYESGVFAPLSFPDFCEEVTPSPEGEDVADFPFQVGVVEYGAYVGFEASELPPAQDAAFCVWPLPAADGDDQAACFGGYGGFWEELPAEAGPGGGAELYLASAGWHPSVGSEGHLLGNCRPCCFAAKGRCANGEACPYCHYDHERRRRAKARVSRRQRGPAAEGFGADASWEQPWFGELWGDDAEAVDAPSAGEAQQWQECAPSTALGDAPSLGAVPGQGGPCEARGDPLYSWQ